MTFRLGLTGSIGMGKSTTARIFRDEGCAVWDADEAVQRVYAKDGLSVEPMFKLFPQAVVEGAVSRDRLKDILKQTPEALQQIERIVHPLVKADRENFLQQTKSEICVFDIPLLFETGSNESMDAVVCVTNDPDVQRKRVLERGTMSEAQFESILANQIPDKEKRRRSDFVIVTDTIEHAREQVRNIIRQIREKLGHA